MDTYMQYMMKSAMITLAVLACITLAACNTVEGMGRDVEGLGRTITGASQDNR